MNQDSHFLQHALRVGARHLGRTWPNPSVGCVLVKNGQVVGAAATAETGRPHAETQALQQAGEHARGATAYVTLEPCTHVGQTPACAQALIDAGVARVVIACEDMDPRVAGKSEVMLRNAGIAVDKILLPAAAAQHRGFFRKLQHSMPYVAMKLATSADAQMRDHTGMSQWITGEEARAHGHRLRAQFDAVVTGIGTVLADDPGLDVRLVPSTLQPLRVVLDSQLRTPPTARLLQLPGQALIYTAAPAAHTQSQRAALATAGALVLDAPATPPSPTAAHGAHNAHAQVDLPSVLHDLARRGINELHMEAGAHLSGAWLQAGLVNELLLYLAPQLLGPGTGLAQIGPFTALAQGVALQFAEATPVGPDLRIRARCMPNTSASGH